MENLQVKNDHFATAYRFRGFTIPQYMLEVLKRYIEKGDKPGDFLTAVICNDLFLAIGNADDHNLKNLSAYIGYLYNEAPTYCWGSREKMQNWINSKS